jgi:hypothetical protein
MYISWTWLESGWNVWETCVSSKNITLTTWNWIKTITMKWRDSAGNETSVVSRNINYSQNIIVTSLELNWSKAAYKSNCNTWSAVLVTLTSTACNWYYCVNYNSQNTASLACGKAWFNFYCWVSQDTTGGCNTSYVPSIDKRSNVEWCSGTKAYTSSDFSSWITWYESGIYWTMHKLWCSN